MGRDGHKQHGLYNKIPFEKIYVTLRIKMKVLPLHEYHSVVLLLHAHGLVTFERELEREQGIQRAVLREMQEVLTNLPACQSFYSEPLYSILCQLERKKKNQIFRPN